MVVVDYDYEEFRKVFNLPKDKVVEGLTEIGAPTEVNAETGKIYTELTPNRPDWYSLEGLARALRSYYKKENGKYEVRKSGYKVKVDDSVSGIRPYTACAAVKNLKLNDQKIRDIVLLQEKLLYTLGRKVKRFGIGVYPLRHIEFPVRYTTMEPEKIVYTPLNYPHKANAREILKKHPKGQDYGYIIEEFDRFPVFVDNKDRIMALIPIVNSAETGKVDVETSEVFIEVSGTDKTGISQALNIIVCSLADMGGEIYSVDVRYSGGTDVCPNLEYKKMKIDFEKAGRILGIRLEKGKAFELLKRMGYERDGDYVLIPPYRADILDEIDVIEDIAIVYGYNNFEPTLPDFFTPGKRIRRYDALDSIFREMGFIEISTFVLTNKEKLGRVGYEGRLKEIMNPSSQEFTVVRPTLVVDMLDVFSVNKMRGLPQKFFEIGEVYENGKTKKKLCFGVSDKNLEFSGARGYLQTMMKELGSGYSLKNSKDKLLEPPYSTAVMVNKKERGMFGRINSGIMEEFGLKFPVFICELEIE